MSDVIKTPYSDYAMTCAKHGDCIFDEVQKGAKKLERAWEKSARNWPKLISKAAKKGFLGLQKGVGEAWLRFILFQPHRRWPQGLSSEQVQLLRLVKVMVEFHSGQGLALSDESPADKETLDAMKKLAHLVKKDIGQSMWRSYETISEQAAKEIAPLCEVQFGESCTQDEAKEIFKGDLLRGWKVGSLSVDTPFYKVYPRFKDWVTG